MIKAGFPPLIKDKPKALILGSMPGEASLRKQQYYANPRNAFWEIMGALLNFSHDAQYTEKIQALMANNIALWDVIETCQRKGSLDSSIVSDTIRVNDFKSLFCEYPTIRYVYFNGGKAEKEFNKRVRTSLKQIRTEIRYQLLPSTSPAHARISKQEKIALWSIIKVQLQE